jgi:four helix bundle protein
MDEQQFKERTRNAALRIIRLVDALPTSRAADVIGRQLLRCGTSIGANYRAACRGKSAADMVAKLAIVEEEADEAIYWTELLIDARLVAKNRLANLMDELNQIVAMIVASQRTLKRKIAKPRK